MKQLQFYKVATWGLLVLNLSMVAFFFLTAPPPHHGRKLGGQKAGAIMKMNDQQNESFHLLAEEHMKKMEGFNNQQRNLLKPYFSSLIDSKAAINSDSLLNKVQLLERNKIESTYQHFQDVKSILKPEQHTYFEEFVEHAMGRILLGQKKNLPPPKRK